VARELQFPAIVKPNIGGSGAGIVRFDGFLELAAAVDSGAVSGGLDGTLLLQEYHPPRDRSIVRVETLEGRYLYGIRIHLGEGAGFDLCPADVCKTVDGVDLVSAACPVGAGKAGLAVEPYTPPRDVIGQVERIAHAARLDVGGIEYLESARDGHLYFYDINALSNFVADPVRVVGFDPTERLVDALVTRAELGEKEPAAAFGRRS
jgi:glutathione synthase/RimK-type ligase-like ATP-grasp enzyme